MAKQDLVVKLLLDSGAFGQDIREAERKTQEFKNGMEGAAGKVGDFGREIGISAGALGKLGGLLTGAGGVVAAVGAFKSVMDSSYNSSRNLRGQIAGFESVIDNFQRSIAEFDWSNWRSGLDDVYRAGKEAEQAMIDANRAATAHSLVKSTGLNKITGLEYLFDTAKTEAEANEYKEQALKEVKDLKRKTENLGDLVDDEFIKTVRNMDSGKLKMEFITAEDATKWLHEAADYILADKSPNDPYYGKKTQDMRDYNRISQFIKDVDYVEKKGRRAVREEEEKSAKWGDQTSMAYNKDMADAAQKKADYYKSILDNLDENIAKRDNLISENQGLFFRNAIYKMPEDVYSEMVEPRITASDELESIRAKELEIEKWEWSDKTPKGGSTGGSTTKPPKKEDDVEHSKAEGYLSGKVDDAKSEMAEFDPGTEEWWEAANALKKYQAQLDETIKHQNALLGIVGEYDDTIEGQIARYEELIDQKKILKKHTSEETQEWHRLTEEIEEYTKKVDDLKEKQAKYDGTSTSSSKSKSKNEESEEKRKAAVDAWNEREKYDRDSDAWEEANAKLKAAVAEYQMIVKSLDENDPVDRLIKKWANANMVVSSSVSVLSALGDALANSEDESAKKAAAWIDVFSTIGAGVQSYISIMQAAIATDEAYAMAKATGQAAMLPFPANIAAIATVVATLTSVIAKINSIRKSAGKFAEGGIVGGTSYSGDKLFAMVNSGEMILNKRQQSNLGNMLGNNGGGQVEFHISGDSLVGVLNNKRNKNHLTR